MAPPRDAGTPSADPGRRLAVAPGVPPASPPDGPLPAPRTFPSAAARQPSACSEASSEPGPTGWRWEMDDRVQRVHEQIDRDRLRRHSNRVLHGHPSPTLWDEPDVPVDEILKWRRHPRSGPRKDLLVYVGIPFCLPTTPDRCGFCLFPSEVYKGPEQLVTYLRYLRARGRALPRLVRRRRGPGGLLRRRDGEPLRARAVRRAPGRRPRRVPPGPRRRGHHRGGGPALHHGEARADAGGGRDAGQPGRPAARPRRCSS